MKVVMERKGEKADNQAPWNGVSENQTQRKKIKHLVGVVSHTSNPSTQEAEAGGL
jgi:hypothetical protein